MRVRCERAALDADGWPAVGEQYVVLELFAYAGASPVLRLLGPDGTATRLCDAGGFRVVAHALPSAWSVRLDARGTLSLGPERWRAPGFWPAQLEQVPDAVAAFVELRDRLLAEDALDRGDADEPTLALALDADELGHAVAALAGGPPPGSAAAPVDCLRLLGRLRDAHATLDRSRTVPPVAPIEDPDARTHAAAAFERVLTDQPQSTRPFERTLADRLVLFPLDGALLGIDLLAAIAAAAAEACGERDAYLSPHEPVAGTRAVYRVALGDWRAYEATCESLPTSAHSLFSPVARWAVVTGADGSGAAAGEPGFMAALRRHLPHEEAAMLDALRSEHARVKARGIDVRWVEEFLAHVHGPERAARLYGLL